MGFSPIFTNHFGHFAMTLDVATPCSCPRPLSTPRDGVHHLQRSEPSHHRTQQGAVAQATLHLAAGVFHAEKMEEWDEYEELLIVTMNHSPMIKKKCRELLVG